MKRLTPLLFEIDARPLLEAVAAPGEMDPAPIDREQTPDDSPAEKPAPPPPTPAARPDPKEVRRPGRCDRCGKPAPAGRVYCSARCKTAEARQNARIFDKIQPIDVNGNLF